MDIDKIVILNKINNYYIIFKKDDILESDDMLILLIYPKNIDKIKQITEKNNLIYLFKQLQQNDLNSELYERYIRLGYINDEKERDILYSKDCEEYHKLNKLSTPLVNNRYVIDESDYFDEDDNLITESKTYKNIIVIDSLNNFMITFNYNSITEYKIGMGAQKIKNKIFLYITENNKHKIEYFNERIKKYIFSLLHNILMHKTKPDLSTIPKECVIDKLTDDSDILKKTEIKEKKGKEIHVTSGDTLKSTDEFDPYFDDDTMNDGDNFIETIGYMEDLDSKSEKKKKSSTKSSYDDTKIRVTPMDNLSLKEKGINRGVKKKNYFYMLQKIEKCKANDFINDDVTYFTRLLEPSHELGYTSERPYESIQKFAKKINCIFVKVMTKGLNKVQLMIITMQIVCYSKTANRKKYIIDEDAS